MAAYEFPVRDFMKRTMDNLNFVDRHERNPNVWEVTQLVNSLLGALAHPWEMWAEDLDDQSLDDAREQGFPVLEKDDYRDIEPESLGDLLRLVRNAIAHGNIIFVNDNYDDVKALQIWNVVERTEKGGIVKQWRNWGTTISVTDLRRLLDRFVALVSELPDEQDRRPPDHIKDRIKIRKD